MPESLQDQVAVVTGASSEIGLAIARALAAEGAQLGARSQPKLDQAVATLGEAVIAVRADVTDAADVEAVLDAADSLMASEPLTRVAKGLAAHYPDIGSRRQARSK
jgi:NAD(P)-dependent dehydrogenase (short-subunit alcohol dehydrogenase family)